MMKLWNKYATGYDRYVDWACRFQKKHKVFFTICLAISWVYAVVIWVRVFKEIHEWKKTSKEFEERLNDLHNKNYMF